MKQQGVLFKNQEQSLGGSGLAVGEKAPSFVAMDQNGQTFKMDDFKGRKRILAFITPGCTPCAETIEVLNAFSQDAHAVVVLIVGNTDRQQNMLYAVEHHAQMPILTPDATVDDFYQIRMKPFAFVIDEDGIVRAQGGLNNREHLEGLLTMAYPAMSISQ
jgi:methylamine dehydrogenase accessory protein MauD